MEDVQWARSLPGAGEASFLFLADSAARDKNAYPTPSDYVIPFPEALHNVFAIDLLDASVPRTEYTVEAHCNGVAYAPGTDGHVAWTLETARVAGALAVATVEPGDYNLPQLIVALTAALERVALARGHLPVTVEAVSDPAEQTNKLRFVRAEPFALFMDASSMRDLVGFGNRSHAPGAALRPDGTARFSRSETNDDDTFTAAPFRAAAALAFAGPVPVTVPGFTASVAATKAQTFAAAASGRLASVRLRGVTATARVVRCTVSDAAGLELAACDIAAAPGGVWTGAFGGGVDLLAGRTYAVAFRGGVEVYVAETFADDDASAWDGRAGTAVSADLTVTVGGWAVEAPGQCNLVGERYVLVRSPNVESLVQRSFAAFDRLSPGLGMCKLGGAGYRDQRFDFVAYQSRAFFPNTLNRIHVRLQTRGGRLYDAHGLDHTLLLLVRMHAAPPQLGGESRHPGNPGYRPNPVAALQDRLTRLRSDF